MKLIQWEKYGDSNVFWGVTNHEVMHVCNSLK